MPHPHEQLLRTNYEAFVVGDMAPMLDSFADDIDWHVSGPVLSPATTRERPRCSASSEG
jgi:ketosteroid isomerase-like protein